MALRTCPGSVMSQSTISTGSRPMRTALPQRRTDALTEIPASPCSTSTTRPPMKPPAPVTRIGRSEGNIGGFSHGVEPRHGEALAPTIALLDHGDGGEHLPPGHGRLAFAAHRPEKVRDHVVFHLGK